MRTIAIIISVLTLIQSADGQSGEGFPGTLDLHVVPLTMIDGNPRLRIGMEYHTRAQLGYSLELGWGNKLINDSRLDQVIWGKDYSFFEIRPEIKWYRKEFKQYATYFSAEMFYLRMKDKLENQTYYPDNPLPLMLLFNSASFKKEKIGLQIKAGIKFLFLKKIVLDLYSGIGVAYRNIKYTDVVNPIIHESSLPDINITPYKNEGNAFLWQLSFGMRIGYVIGRWK